MKTLPLLNQATAFLNKAATAYNLLMIEAFLPLQKNSSNESYELLQL